MNDSSLQLSAACKASSASEDTDKTRLAHYIHDHCSECRHVYTYLKGNVIRNLNLKSFAESGILLTDTLLLHKASMS